MGPSPAPRQIEAGFPGRCILGAAGRSITPSQDIPATERQHPRPARVFWRPPRPICGVTTCLYPAVRGPVSCGSGRHRLPLCDPLKELVFQFLAHLVRLRREPR